MNDLGGAADFKEDCDGGLHEVLVTALEREADRLEELETALITLQK